MLMITELPALKDPSRTDTKGLPVKTRVVPPPLRATTEATLWK